MQQVKMQEEKKKTISVEEVDANHSCKLPDAPAPSSGEKVYPVRV